MDEQKRAFYFPASYIVAYSYGKVWRALLGSSMTLRVTFGGNSRSGMRWSYPGVAKLQTSGVRCEASRRTGPPTFAAGTKYEKPRCVVSENAGREERKGRGGLTGSASLPFDAAHPARSCCEVEVLEDRVLCGLFEEDAAGSHESGAVCCDRRRDSIEGWASLWRSVLLGRVD